jgi:hypothetical protein
VTTISERDALDALTRVMDDLDRNPAYQTIAGHTGRCGCGQCDLRRISYAAYAAGALRVLETLCPNLSKSKGGK